MSKSLDNLFPIEIDSPEAMIEFGKTIAQHLRSGDVLALIGNLGAGKTHLTQGVARHFNYDGPVTSPTFGLVHEYAGTKLIHADLYRLNDPHELLSIGWEDYLERDAILVIEWADRFPELMPEGTHWIKVDHTATGRKLTYALH